MKTLGIFVLGIVALMGITTTPTKADQLVNLDDDATTCFPYPGYTLIHGVWTSTITGDISEDRRRNDIFGNWTCYPETGFSSAMKIEYNDRVQQRSMQVFCHGLCFDSGICVFA